MSDFSSLLGKFQKQAPQIAAATRKEKEAAARKQQERPTKRQRQIDASKDFKPVKEILILCPAGVQTGGPEALHQLCDQINTNSIHEGVVAYMVYCKRRIPGDGKLGVDWEAQSALCYSNYKAPMIEASQGRDPLEDTPSPTSLMVWPEVWTAEMLEYQSSVHDNLPTPCAIWWLSVNNNTRKFQQWDRKDILHLYQSEYAKQHLLKHGATHIYELTEYISNPPKEQKTAASRTIDILFNPMKGMNFTDAIRQRSEGTLIKFQPIGGGVDGQIRIPPEEVRRLLQQAKIYIDFGPHPGMDRLPREAALAGCLVVTNREGSALYEQDVPLPAKYKINKFDVEAIHELLKDLLANYEERCKELDEYRTWIRGQRIRMTEKVEKLLVALVDERNGNRNPARGGVSHDHC